MERTRWSRKCLRIIIILGLKIFYFRNSYRHFDKHFQNVRTIYLSPFRDQKLRCRKWTARRSVSIQPCQPLHSLITNLIWNAFQEMNKANVEITRALQPVATRRQSPYLRKPAIVIMTSFSLWLHSLLRWPRPALRTNVCTLHMDTLPRLIYIHSEP